MSTLGDVTRAKGSDASAHRAQTAEWLIVAHALIYFSYVWNDEVYCGRCCLAEARTTRLAGAVVGHEGTMWM